MMNRSVFTPLGVGHTFQHDFRGSGGYKGLPRYMDEYCNIHKRARTWGSGSQPIFAFDLRPMKYTHLLNGFYLSVIMIMSSGPCIDMQWLGHLSDMVSFHFLQR